MKKTLYDYVVEAGGRPGRPKGSKNQSKEEETVVVANNNKPVVTPDQLDLGKIPGKKPETNGSRGTFAIDEPTNDDNVKDIDVKSLNKGEKLLYMKLKAEEDFFIQGQAGWGKTSVIKNMAKKFHRSIITVYLDKAVASDLGGIPIPTHGKSGNAQVEMAMPAWAAYMLEHPETQFLLFFDEMNQASGDVQNALMPIILEHEICNVKFDNFFCGAAGNRSDENDYLTELSKPLQSRFKPIIIWESDTDEAWASVFKFLHKNWDNVLGKDFVDLYEKNAKLFEAPREIDHKIFKFINKIIKAGNNEDMEPEIYLARLEGLVKDDLSRTEIAQLEKLAQDTYTFVLAGGNVQKPQAGRSANRTREMIDPEMMEIIKHGMIDGYVTDGEGNAYGVARENIQDLIDPAEMTAEQLERVISKFEADGLKFKYEKVADFKHKKNLKVHTN